jgi:hypothetical protein
MSNSLRKYLADGTIDLDTDDIRCAMLSSSYAANAAHSIFGDVSAHEVTAGNGYSAGGSALTNKSVTLSGSTSKFTADPATWPGLTKTYRFLALYAVKTANGVVNPLVAVILVDNTPADIVITAADYSVQWNANGILTIS